MASDGESGNVPPRVTLHEVRHGGFSKPVAAANRGHRFAPGDGLPDGSRVGFDDASPKVFASLRRIARADSAAARPPLRNAVGDVVGIRPFEQVSDPDARAIVTTMQAAGHRPSAVLEKPRNTMRDLHPFAEPKSAIPFRVAGAGPRPAGAKFGSRGDRWHLDFFPEPSKRVGGGVHSKTITQIDGGDGNGVGW